MLLIRAGCLRIRDGCVRTAIGCIVVGRRPIGKGTTWRGHMVKAKIDLAKLQFEIMPRRTLAGVEVDVFKSMSPTHRSYRGLGIDPGRNFGLASILGRDIFVYVGQMAKEEEQWLRGA